MRRPSKKSTSKSKVSEMLMDVARDYIVMGEDIEEKQQLLNGAASAWNIACLNQKVWHACLPKPRHRQGAKIPADVRKTVNEEDLLNLGGVHKDKNAGDPLEYGQLKLVLTDNGVEITVFNRGITLLMRGDERVRRIRRVLCKLDESGKG